MPITDNNLFISYQMQIMFSQGSNIVVLCDIALDKLYEKSNLKTLTDVLKDIPNSVSILKLIDTGIDRLTDEEVATFFASVPPWVSKICVTGISKERQASIFKIYKNMILENEHHKMDYDVIFNEKASCVADELEGLANHLENIKKANYSIYSKLSDLLDQIQQQLNVVKANPEVYFNRNVDIVEFTDNHDMNDDDIPYLTQNKFIIIQNLLAQLKNEIFDFDVELVNMTQEEPSIKDNSSPDSLVESKDELSIKQPDTVPLVQQAPPLPELKEEQQDTKTSQDNWLRIFKPKMDTIKEKEEEASLITTYSHAFKENFLNYVDSNSFSHHQVTIYNEKTYNTKNPSYLWTSGLADCVAIGAMIHSEDEIPKKAILYHSVSEHSSTEEIDKILRDYEQNNKYERQYKFIYAIYDFLKDIQSDDKIEVIIYFSSKVVKNNGMDDHDVKSISDIFNHCLHFLNKDKVQINLHPISGNSQGFFLTPTGIAGLLNP